MRIGELELLPVNDGLCKLPQHFSVGLDFEAHAELLAEDGRVHIPIGCFVVRTGDTTVLVAMIGWAVIGSVILFTVGALGRVR